MSIKLLVLLAALVCAVIAFIFTLGVGSAVVWLLPLAVLLTVVGVLIP